MIFLCVVKDEYFKGCKNYCYYKGIFELFFEVMFYKNKGFM